MSFATVEDRFHAKVAPDDMPNGCLLWVASVDQFGYGQFWFDGRRWRSHRWSYRRFVGELVPGLVIDHICRNRKCVNPEHLRQVTQRENTFADGSIAPAKLNAEKDACVHGHPFTPDNIYVFADGGRRCRTCSIRRASMQRRTAA